jgi:hypothetical protein
MPLFALDPWWNDFYTIGGFIAGIIGAVVSIGGFWIAIGQIRKTMHAAQAAQAAANKTLIESKKSYARFVGSFASRLMSELQRAVNTKEWKIADLRAHDLAEVLGTLTPSSSVVASIVRRLRAFGQEFADIVSGEKSSVGRTKWKELLTELHARLDTLRAPFGDVEHDEIGSQDPTDHIPDNRSQSPGEDESRSGELDPPQAGDPT